MTKDEITVCVHKNVDDAIRKNIKQNVDSVSKLISSIDSLHCTGDDPDSLAQDVAQVIATLYQDIVEQSTFVTIHTLFDLGLLTQDEPE